MKTRHTGRLFPLSMLILLVAAVPASADLDIGGILRIEGSVTLTNNGSQEIGAAAGLDVFIGEGDAILPDSSINPLARGILLTDAVVGVVKVGSDYAVTASGSGILIGVEGVTLTGPLLARVNMLQTAVDESILVEGTSDFISVSFNLSEVASPAGDPFYEVLGNSIGIDVLGQLISTDLNVRKISLDRSGSVEEALYFGLANAITSFSDGINDIITFSDAFGDFLVMSDGAAAFLPGNFSSPALTGSGDFFLQINTTSQAVDGQYDLDGDLRTLSVTAGPKVEMVTQDSLLSILDQTFTGNFSFQQDSGGTVLAQAVDVTCILGDGVAQLLTLNGGSGVMLLTPGGAGLDIQGAASFADPQISASANVNLQINSSGSAINQTISIGGSTQDLSLEAGPFVRMVTVDAQLAVLESQLFGDFQIEQGSSGSLVGLLSNGSLLMNDGADDALVVANGAGAIFMNSSGTGMEIAGEVSIVDPGISVAGPFIATINTGTQLINETLFVGGSALTLDLSPGPYVRVTGPDNSLIIAGETLTGDWLFEQQSGSPVAIALTNGAYQQAGGLVAITEGTGAFLLFSNGIAGELGGLTTLSIPGLAIASPLNFQVNTTFLAINAVVNAGAVSISINLPQGPIMRMLGTGVPLSIAGQTLSGDLISVESSPATVDLSLSSVSFDMGSGVFFAADAEGLLKADASGAAGALLFPIGVFNSASVSLAGVADIALVNTRPTQVLGTFDLGSGILDLDLPGGPYFRVPFFDALLVLNRLSIGGFPVNVTGDVVLEPSGGPVRMVIENADLSGDGTTLILGTGGGDLLLTEGGLVVVLDAPTIDYGISLDEALSITGGDFAVSAPVSLRIHPGILQDGDVPLIDFSLATSSVTAGNFTVSPSLPDGFDLAVSSGQLLLSSPDKPDTDDDGLSDAWESTYGPDDTSLLPTDNSDGDNLDALAEFALGLNPTISDFPELVPALITVDGQEYLSLTYPRNPDAIGLVGIFTERSTDLGNTDPWSFDETIFESSTPTEVTDRSVFPRTSDSREFLRLMFIKP